MPRTGIPQAVAEPGTAGFDSRRNPPTPRSGKPLSRDRRTGESAEIPPPFRMAEDVWTKCPRGGPRKRRMICFRSRTDCAKRGPGARPPAARPSAGYCATAGLAVTGRMRSAAGSTTSGDRRGPHGSTADRQQPTARPPATAVFSWPLSDGLACMLDHDFSSGGRIERAAFGFSGVITHRRSRTCRGRPMRSAGRC